jgi:hypothetical protein
MDMQTNGFKMGMPDETTRAPFDAADLFNLYPHGFLNSILRCSKNGWIILALELET